MKALVGSPPHGQKQLIEPLQFEAEINEQAGIAPGRSQQQSPPLPED
jgi:spastic paraplegia protein 7